MVQPLLRLEGLETSYGKQRGVGPVDLELPAGIHGLLGPNGSGKTTLIKTLLGFLTPTSGRGTLLGFDVVQHRLEIRRRIGYMAENDVLVPGLTPTQTVRVAAELCGIPAARAHEVASEALHAVGMGDERFHAPQRLSTGQRQRVKLAAALVHSPDLLFLDEPTNGLDPAGRRALLELIREISVEKDISVILSTHILPDIEMVCDDAVVLRDGRLVATERVGARALAKQADNTWFKVEVLGDPQDFVAVAKQAQLSTTHDPTGIRVAAQDVAAIFQVAKKADVLLATCTPATTGVEEAVLGHLHGGAP